MIALSAVLLLVSPAAIDCVGSAQRLDALEFGSDEATLAIEGVQKSLGAEGELLFAGFLALRPEGSLAERQRRQAAVLKGALGHRCPAPELALAPSGPPSGEARALSNPAAAQAKAQALLEDEAFTGDREGPDFIDRWLEAARIWFFDLLESEGMQRYAESLRSVYVAVLLLVAAFALFRFWRARRKFRKDRSLEDQDEALSTRRRRDAAVFLEESEKALGEGLGREAIWLAFLALLARLGEVKEGAAEPSRTHREILAELSGPLAAELKPCFSSVEETIYRRRGTAEVPLEQAQSLVASAKSLLSQSKLWTAGASARPAVQRA